MRSVRCFFIVAVTFASLLFVLINLCKTVRYDNVALVAVDTVPRYDAFNILITVKTSKKFHTTRLNEVIDSWFGYLDKIQIPSTHLYFVTDAFDEKLNSTCNFQAIATLCGHEHTRKNLCCKMNTELELYVAHLPSWACHFDDDNYVNLFQLEKLLKKFDERHSWYLGKPSTIGHVHVYNSYQKARFRFATGGAGFCLSRSLIIKMQKHILNGGFEVLGNYLRLPDDVTLGYLIVRTTWCHQLQNPECYNLAIGRCNSEHLLNVRLTVISEFHSHLEQLSAISQMDIPYQVSFSAGKYDSGASNLVDVPLRFSEEADPSRFRSLHYYLTQTV